VVTATGGRRLRQGGGHGWSANDHAAGAGGWRVDCTRRAAALHMVSRKVLTCLAVAAGFVELALSATVGIRWLRSRADDGRRVAAVLADAFLVVRPRPQPRNAAPPIAARAGHDRCAPPPARPRRNPTATGDPSCAPTSSD
jgi:hypothetical protein